MIELDVYIGFIPLLIYVSTPELKPHRAVMGSTVTLGASSIDLACSSRVKLLLPERGYIIFLKNVHNENAVKK